MTVKKENVSLFKILNILSKVKSFMVQIFSHLFLFESNFMEMKNENLRKRSDSSNSGSSHNAFATGTRFLHRFNFEVLVGCD